MSREICVSELRIVLLGPVPPPYHGVSVITQGLLEALPRESLRVYHIDTTIWGVISSCA